MRDEAFAEESEPNESRAEGPASFGSEHVRPFAEGSLLSRLRTLYRALLSGWQPTEHRRQCDESRSCQSKCWKVDIYVLCISTWAE